MLLDNSSALTQEAAGLEINGLTEDSREVEPGFLFAALPGTVTDGAQYVPQALDRGAAAVLMPSGGARALGSIDTPVIEVRNPRRAFALMAARFFGRQPATVAAVTGTNGKTSVAHFLRQLWLGLGHQAASLGTLGIAKPSGHKALRHTTPDPVTLYRELADLADEGIDHLAMEASSHGLAQFRMDGVEVDAAAFTNLSRDHLDYHANFEDYLYAKLRLFGEVMRPGGLAVINADGDQSAEFEAVSWARGHHLMTVGRRGKGICLVGRTPSPRGQSLTVVHAGENYDIELPLIGGFQASNALVAAGLAIGLGADAGRVFQLVGGLQGATGRLEAVAETQAGGHVIVDYAHTPDALATALEAVRPHAEGRLVVVFGCGGDRDAGKRPQMGEIAGRLADIAVVTDDNPRTEDAASIRAQILTAVPGATEIGDRAEAIRQAVAMLEQGDLLLVAGKGHETGQIIGDTVIPFSDQTEVRRAVKALEAQS